MILDLMEARLDLEVCLCRELALKFSYLVVIFLSISMFFLVDSGTLLIVPFPFTSFLIFPSGSSGLIFL